MYTYLWSSNTSWNLTKRWGYY